MFKIDWHQLEKNTEASEVTFEKFNYQIAIMKYSQFGRFQYYYNTPGSEFYLTLTKDCEELSASAGAVIGWQVKFWLNKTDEENSPLDTKHRAELIEGFKTSIAYKPELRVWVICTPGLFSNTKPSCPVDQLEKELHAVKPDISIVYWNKPNYETLFHSAPEQFASIFNLYFSSHYLGYRLFREHCGKRLDLLRKRYDTDLYTPGDEDRRILTSIFYRDHLPKLHDQLKHALEDSEKLANSTFYIETIEKFLNQSDGASSEDKAKVDKARSLLNSLLEILGELSAYAEQENTVSFLKVLHAVISSRAGTINRLISELSLADVPIYGTYIDHNPDVDNPSEFINYILNVTATFLGRVGKIYEVLSGLTQQVYHVFAEAGYGKTNLSCSLTEILLSKNLPVLLIPASEIRGVGESIEKQILGFLDIDNSTTFQDLIGILDSLGFLYGIKLPIIIDGLNETQPSAALWRPAVDYIARDVIKRANLMLVTTCRNAYAGQVFGEESAEAVSNSIVMPGFTQNVDEAIRKYFEKYSIIPRNTNFSRDLFRNPLMLRIFCEANEGKTTEITESNIYAAVDLYIDQIIKKISTQNHAINPLLRSQILRGIEAYCLSLWNNSSIRVLYPNEVSRCFDPAYYSGQQWPETITYKVIDEGLLFRNIHTNIEYAEFNHDLIGGFCIAKNVIFSGEDPDQKLAKLRSRETLVKLTAVNPENRHPLAEDILKAAIFLCPQHTGKELYELIDAAEIDKTYIHSLGITLSRENGTQIVLDHFRNIPLNHPHLALLLESILNEVFKDKKHLGLVELLKIIVLRCEYGQVDLLWSEIVRHKSTEVIRFLERELILLEEADSLQDESNVLLLAALFLSSTNRYLRDLATKLLVCLGGLRCSKLWDVFLSLAEIKDYYVIDRLVASICGALLRTNNGALLTEICNHLEERYFMRGKTSYVLILDYVDTLLRYAEMKCDYRRRVTKPLLELTDWQEDQECRQQIADDYRAEWGFGPVDYEFAKYKIGSYLSRKWKHDSRLPTLVDALARVVWKAKELGYSKDIFEMIDISITKDGARYRNAVTQSYSKKYSKMAFYELYGLFLIDGVLKDVNEGDGFRIPVRNTDPTFPKLAQKRQVVIRSFLPSGIDDVQEWITREETPLLEDHCFKSSDMRSAGSDWVMLYGRATQQGIGKSRIDIGAYSVIVSETKADQLTEGIARNEVPMWRFVSESHHALAGEIPWNDNFLDERTRVTIDGVEIEIYFPVTVYLNESNSGLETARDVKMPSRTILRHFGLTINLNNFNFYLPSNELASMYLYDNHSSFLYLRSDLLRTYLRDSKQSLIWIDISSKYGDFGESNPGYNPSFCDHHRVRLFEQ